ncbi:MAG TPA: S41 family peptidase [Firmicutes bacterium]|nr:S41 family peptidase [Bacillota bacterium]
MEKRRAVFYIFTAFVLGLVVPFLFAAKGVNEKTSQNLIFQVQSMIENNYVEEVDNKDLIYGALKGMLNSLDSNSGFLTPEQAQEMRSDLVGEFGGIGIHFAIQDGIFTVISPIEDTPAEKVGLRPNDKIIRIDGVDTKNLSTDDGIKMMRGAPGTKVILTILRTGENDLIDFTIIRDIIKIKSVKYEKVDNDIGYLRITDFKEKTGQEVREAMVSLNNQKVKGIILDLRYNPGGYLSSAVDVSDLFLPGGKVIVSVKGRSQKSIRDYYSTNVDRFTEQPMVVLINIGSASASEIVSAALRDNKRAVLIGEKSFGKGSVQNIFPLADGSAARITIAKYYTPTGICIHGLGIEPDVKVESYYISRDDSAKLKTISEKEIFKKYIKDHEEMFKNKYKDSSKFKDIKGGYDKNEFETFLLDPENIYQLNQKLKNENLEIEFGLMKRELAKEIRIKLEGENKYKILEPETDLQLAQAISIIKSMLILNKDEN